MAHPSHAVPHLATAKLQQSGRCVLPHSVTVVRTVPLTSGVVVVAAGETTISAGSLAAWLASGVSCTSARGAAGSHERCVQLSAGVVSAMAVEPLAQGSVALGCAGTTQGSLCVFAVEAARKGLPVRIAMVDEVPLSSLSGGLIGSDDIVVDVAIGFDPAARPEFVAVATSTAVLVVDVGHFSSAFKARAADPVVQSLSNAVQHGGLHYLRRPPTALFSTAFYTADVVRLLVPTRRRAAVDPGTALIIVQEDGVLRFVERHITGGAVQLLATHHFIQQQQRDPFLADVVADGGELGPRAAATSRQNPEMAKGGKFDPGTLPHVVYAYNLSGITCDAAAVDDSRGVPRANVTINDAQLSVGADGNVDIVLAGVERLPLHSSASSGASPTGPMAVPTGTALAAGAVPAHTSGWWAVVRQALPHVSDAVERRRSSVVSFSKPKLGALPRDRRGLSRVIPLGDGLVLFASCNELHLGSLQDTGVAIGALHHVHTLHSVVADMTSPTLRVGGGRTAVLLASGPAVLLVQV